MSLLLAVPGVEEERAPRADDPSLLVNQTEALGPLVTPGKGPRTTKEENFAEIPALCSSTSRPTRNDLTRLRLIGALREVLG